MAIAGPFGTSLLADMGANVIKVEPPQGDALRNLARAHKDKIDHGAPFATINRNKRSIVLNLKLDEDREKLLELCEKADAIVENMRSGIMDKLGLSYEIINARNPKIVYGAVRGFGDPRTGEGPYSQWPSYDVVAQSMGGMVDITGPRGSTGFPTGGGLGDLYPGTLMALGVVSAIHAARNSGNGSFVDVSMFDSMIALNSLALASYAHSGRDSQPVGEHQHSLVPFGIFPASDGGISICAPGQNHWEILCHSMERPELINDERFVDSRARIKNVDLTIAEVSAWTSTKTRYEILDILAGQVPCGPVNHASDIFNDPHIKARKMLTTYRQSEDKDMTIAENAIKIQGIESTFQIPAPSLGQHSSEVLNEFGIE